VLPLDGIEEQVLEHVPRDVTLTVTVSPTKGLETTLGLAERLVGHGYTVVPHLSARLVESQEQLAELVARAAGLGIRDVFVVAGDAPEPHGPFDGAAALLDAMAELGHPFEEVGITGYPESHPLIDDATTIEAMFAKERHATYITSQVCFDPGVTAGWVEEVWARGTRLPIYVGVPGAVSRAKLLRVSTRIGIGDSLRFLRKHGSFASRFLHGGFSPDPLIDGLGPLLTDPERKLAGFHVFTFNDVEDTERWRRHRLAAGGRS
jgi:methylenetetrahydrofolate reductase (NADPH)